MATANSSNEFCQAAPTFTKDFGDERVFIVTPSDQRLAVISSNHCRFEQACDGPTFVVVGPLATGDQLAWVSERFNLAIQGLVSFRQQQLDGGL